MADESRDELGAELPDLSKDAQRAMATESRAILGSPAYGEACRRLTNEYLKRFLILKPMDPGYAEACMRTQMACNIVADVTTQLGILSDFGKVSRDLGENIDRTQRGRK